MQIAIQIFNDFPSFTKKLKSIDYLEWLTDRHQVAQYTKMDLEKKLLPKQKSKSNINKVKKFQNPNEVLQNYI